MANIPSLHISQSDLKHSLRKLEFPFSAREALERSEQICMSSDSSHPERFPKNIEVIHEIIAEFIFCEVDKRGNKKRGLKSTSELSLLEVLCDHFSKATPGGVSPARTSLFLWLFHPAAEGRIRVLAKLVSLAISTRRVSVLNTAGLWMQCTLPGSSQATVSLANMLVKDFFVLTPLAATKLRDLPQLAPLFTANLLTAFTAMFGAQTANSYVPPPLSLLEVVTQWVSDNPQLCLTPLLHQTPGPGVVTNNITPIVGLFRWCVLSPLQTTATQESNDTDPPTITEEEKLYSCLHLSMLQSVLASAPGVLPPHSRSAINVEELEILVADIDQVILKSNHVPEPLRLLALDRLGQAIQACLSTSHVSGNPHVLLTKLSRLPQTRLLEILLTRDTQHP